MTDACKIPVDAATIPRMVLPEIICESSISNISAMAIVVSGYHGVLIRDAGGLRELDACAIPAAG